MSVVAVAIGGSAILGAASAAKSSKAASNAANTQAASAQAGIDEQARQFDSIRSLLNPYVQAGTGSFSTQQYLAANPDIAADPYWSQNAQEHYDQIGKYENRPGTGIESSSLYGQQTLLGLNGNGAQQQAINGIQNSAGFQSLLSQGENSIRQNASATGGLRGGNTQGALAQFSPALLAQQIQQQYSNLSGITSMSQNAAAGLGSAGQSSANSVSSLLQQQGAAQAGGIIGGANATNSAYSGIASGLGTLAGYGGFGGFGQTSATGITGTTPTFGAGYTTPSTGFGSGVIF